MSTQHPPMGPHRIRKRCRVTTMLVRLSKARCPLAVPSTLWIALCIEPCAHGCGVLEKGRHRGDH
eukprot:2552100-Alexandrium_andersonii.AAC.1